MSSTTAVHDHELVARISSACMACKVTQGKVKDRVKWRNGKCVTNAVATTDWPHLVASSTYNDAMK